MSCNSAPVLAVCIPTYNRAELLNNLLIQINNLAEKTKSKIQICISDNASTDHTTIVIDEWKNQLGLLAIRQKLNIGASRNFQAVAALANAPRVLLMGDDDLFSTSGFEKLVSLLETVDPETWILADISNQDGTTLLERYRSGAYTKLHFKKAILVDSLLDVIGFMSMHVIPKKSIEKFLTLNIDEIYGWPHLALLFNQLSSVNIYVFKECIVRRGGDNGEVTQTWRANDWLRLMMQKTKLCAASGGWFANGIALREYLCWPYMRQTLYAKIMLKGEGEKDIKPFEYIDATNIWQPTKYLIKFYVLVLGLTPVKLIQFVRNFKKQVSNVEAAKFDCNKSVTDGIDRGL